MSTLNKVKTITIICWAISALALLGLVAWFLVGGLFHFGFGLDGIGIGTFEPVETHNVPADNIDALSIDWTAGRVYVGTHGGNDIQITEFSRRTLRDGEQLSLSTNDGTLAIYFTENRRFGFNNTPVKQLEVLIPYARSEHFEQFYINTVSGRVEVSNIQAVDFTVGTTSGRINLRGIVSSALSASTTSGRIEVSAVQADEIRLHTVSGRITATDTQTESLRTNTTSGRHELSGRFGCVNARSTSGRLEITSTIVPDSLTARTSSGRIEVTIPNEGAIDVQHSTGSGRFTSEIPVTTHSGTEAQFDLSTTSGRITIFELRR